MSSLAAPRAFDAVVFDFDGTIIDTETPVFESWRQTYEACGVGSLSRQEWRANIGHTSQPFHPREELERRLVASGQHFDIDAVVAHRLARRDEMLARLQPRPGIVEWIEAATQRRLPIAVASSSSLGWVEEQLRRIGLRDRFGAVCCAGDGVPGKPDPAVYLHACEGIGVDPVDAVAIEDSPVGVTAGLSAGLCVVAVPGPMTHGLGFGHAPWQAKSLADLTVADWLGPL